MKTKKTLLLFCLTMGMSLISVRAFADPEPIPLQIGYDDPIEEQDKPHKGPILVPELFLDEYTLTFESSHPAYALTLFDEDGFVVYQTAVSATTYTVVLPATLSGTYVLTLDFGGSYYFWSEIEL